MENQAWKILDYIFNEFIPYILILLLLFIFIGLPTLTYLNITKGKHYETESCNR